MDKYTQQDLDNFLTADGRKQYLTGDYSEIKVFPDNCDFGPDSIFGPGSCFGADSHFAEGSCFGAFSYFGPGSRFDAWSTFGPDSIFGADSHFEGHGSRFAENSRFGGGSTFGGGPRFGAFSYFGHGSRFGAWSTFGPDSIFGADSIFEGHKARTDNPFIAIDRAGSESRKTYFFDFVDGLHVRSGCFFGTAEEFREKVLEDVPKDSKKAKQYLGMLEIAKITFGID